MDKKLKNLLITGSFRLSSENLAVLEDGGYQVFFHPDERLPVEEPERYDAVVCTDLFVYNSIERFTDLKTIQLTKAGLDRMPLDYIRDHNIRLQNAAGAYSIPMAEFAIVGILQFYKQSRFFAENQTRHKWEKHHGLMELSDKRVCILGCGDVGRETAKRLNAFGCRITGVNRTVREQENFEKILPLDELKAAAGKCDIFICCIALTENTRGLVNAEIFDSLSTNAVFVNIARGPIVEEAALIAWLQRGGRAVLDVFAQEPLPETSPLWDMKNVILSPHNSYSGDGKQERLWKLACKTLLGKQA